MSIVDNYNFNLICIVDVTVDFQFNAYNYSEDHGTVGNIILLLSNPIAQSLSVVVEGGKKNYTLCIYYIYIIYEVYNYCLYMYIYLYLYLYLYLFIYLFIYIC